MTAMLGPDDKVAISALSRSGIETTTKGLRSYFNRSIWIDSANHYSIDVVNRLEKAAPVTVVHQRDLAQYIAASVILHANDGWSYLGRAVACLLAGDAHRALHMAYYAELRAAMSLLASAGVGIFNTKHFIVPAADQVDRLKMKDGTHVAAWLALEHWSKQPSSGILFNGLIRTEGRTLDNWFFPHGGATALAPQSRDWFMQWGMDLGLASKDRKARNESSYRPDGVPITWQASAEDCLEFIRDMWSVLEPSSNSSFEQIDRHILRLSLERYFKGTTSKVPSPNSKAFVKIVNTTVNAQGLGISASKRLKRFLLRKIDSKDPLIISYSTIAPGRPKTDAFAVLSRAVLLLRVATGSAHDILRRSGFAADILSFWWERLGEARGLWPTGSPPNTLGDLWADIEESFRELDAVAINEPAALQSIYSLAFRMDGRLNVLSSHERVGLWGLCPL
jgi:hypothetical protein